MQATRRPRRPFEALEGAAEPDNSTAARYPFGSGRGAVEPPALAGGRCQPTSSGRMRYSPPPLWRWPPQIGSQAPDGRAIIHCPLGARPRRRRTEESPPTETQRSLKTQQHAHRSGRPSEVAVAGNGSMCVQVRQCRRRVRAPDGTETKFEEWALPVLHPRRCIRSGLCVRPAPRVMHDNSLRAVLHGEFDPGSGRTLAACLTHASGATNRGLPRGRAANG